MGSLKAHPCRSAKSVNVRLAIARIAARRAAIYAMSQTAMHAVAGSFERAFMRVPRQSSAM